MNSFSIAREHRSYLSFAIATTFCACLLAFSAGSASAATTFGSSLTNAPNGGSCGGPSGLECGLAIVDIASDARASGGINAPNDGVIVRWRMRGLPGSATSSTMSLRLYRGNTSVGASADVQPALSGDVEVYDTRIPVQTGDRLGMRHIPIGIGIVIYTSLTYSVSGAGEADYWATPPAVGETAAPNHSDLNRELLLNADIEPDVDADGFGDETQDLCPSNQSVQSVCPSTLPITDDTTKPVVSALKRATTKGFSFVSSEAGTYSIDVDRIHFGRERGNSCSRTAKRGARCKIYRQRSRKSGAATTGPNMVKLSTKRFPPGRYSVSVVVTDAAGNASEPVDREITVRRKRR